MHPDMADGPDALRRDDIGEPLRQQSRDARGRREGIGRCAMGVVPAWFCWPVIVTLNWRRPTMPVTTPTASPAASSTGPCSICASMNALKRTVGPRTRRRGRPPAPAHRQTRCHRSQPAYRHPKRQLARPHGRPRQRAEPPFLILEAHHRYRRPALFPRRARNLQRGDHAIGAVKPAALGLRIGMRAHQKASARPGANPKRLPTGSIRTSSPASSNRSASQPRASRSASENAGAARPWSPCHRRIGAACSGRREPVDIGCHGQRDRRACRRTVQPHRHEALGTC
jgi:hypothetical protein